MSRHVRRTVGIKVLRDVSRWAEGVERERRQRPLLVGVLAVLIVVLAGAAAAVAWFYYRGG